MASEYISREAAREALLKQNLTWEDWHKADAALVFLPTADVREVQKAKWEDVHIDRPEIADLEVASMFCPNCNRWHNRVYQYGNPIEYENFCSFCGADMRVEDT